MNYIAGILMALCTLTRPTLWVYGFDADDVRKIAPPGVPVVRATSPVKDEPKIVLTIPLPYRTGPARVVWRYVPAAKEIRNELRAQR